MDRIVRFYREVGPIAATGIRLSLQGGVIIETELLKGRGEPTGIVMTLPANPKVIRALASVLESMAKKIEDIPESDDFFGFNR